MRVSQGLVSHSKEDNGPHMFVGCFDKVLDARVQALGEGGVSCWIVALKKGVECWNNARVDLQASG